MDHFYFYKLIFEKKCREDIKYLKYEFFIKFHFPQFKGRNGLYVKILKSWLLVVYGSSVFIKTGRPPGSRRPKLNLQLQGQSNGESTLTTP